MFELTLGDSLTQYEHWPRPSIIVSDGPYGVGGYEGDPHTVSELVRYFGLAEL